MTAVTIRANLPLTGMHQGAEVVVELTPFIQKLIDDGRVTVLAEHPDPEPIPDGVSTAAGWCAPAGAPGTSGPNPDRIDWSTVPRGTDETAVRGGIRYPDVKLADLVGVDSGPIAVAAGRPMTDAEAIAAGAEDPDEEEPAG